MIGLVKDGEQNFGRAKVKFGDGAGIRVGGVEVALIAHRTQALGTEIFSAVNIDLATKKYVGVKSTNHFHAGLCADRRQGDLLRRRGPLAAQTRANIHSQRRAVPSGRMPNCLTDAWLCERALWAPQAVP